MVMKKSSRGQRRHIRLTKQHTCNVSSSRARTKQEAIRFLVKHGYKVPGLNLDKVIMSAAPAIPIVDISRLKVADDLENYCPFGDCGSITPQPRVFVQDSLSHEQCYIRRCWKCQGYFRELQLDYTKLLIALDQTEECPHCRLPNLGRHKQSLQTQDGPKAIIFCRHCRMSFRPYVEPQNRFPPIRYWSPSSGLHEL